MMMMIKKCMHNALDNVVAATAQHRHTHIAVEWNNNKTQEEKFVCQTKIRLDCIVHWIMFVPHFSQNTLLIGLQLHNFSVSHFAGMVFYFSRWLSRTLFGVYHCITKSTLHFWTYTGFNLPCVLFLFFVCRWLCTVRLCSPKLCNKIISVLYLVRFRIILNICDNKCSRM